MADYNKFCPGCISVYTPDQIVCLICQIGLRYLTEDLWSEICSDTTPDLSFPTYNPQDFQDQSQIQGQNFDFNFDDFNFETDEELSQRLHFELNFGSQDLNSELSEFNTELPDFETELSEFNTELPDFETDFNMKLKPIFKHRDQFQDQFQDKFRYRFQNQFQDQSQDQTQDQSQDQTQDQTQDESQDQSRISNLNPKDKKYGKYSFNPNIQFRQEIYDPKKHDNIDLTLYEVKRFIHPLNQNDYIIIRERRKD